LEVEDLGKRSVDRISGDVTASLFVIIVADTDVTLDVQDGVLSARRCDGRDQVERIAVGVVVTSNGSNKVGAGGGLLEHSLEVVDRLLICGNSGVELIEATIIYSSNTESESSRHMNAEGELTVLAAGTERNVGADFRIILAESNRDRSASRVEGIVGAPWRATGSIHSQTRDVKPWWSRDRVIFELNRRREPVRSRSCEGAESERKDGKSSCEEVDHV